MHDVLVADDNPLLVSVLAEIFRESGYSVRTAPDGFVALAMIRDRVPDILISDLNMPRMSGFELLSIVRRRFSEDRGDRDERSVPRNYPSLRGSGRCVLCEGCLQRCRTFRHCCTRSRGMRRGIPRAPLRQFWVPALPIGQDDFSVMAIACPECLRTFYHCLHDAELLRAERNCPHCLHPVQLAIV